MSAPRILSLSASVPKGRGSVITGVGGFSSESDEGGVDAAPVIAEQRAADQEANGRVLHIPAARSLFGCSGSAESRHVLPVPIECYE
jgi:hypothetical protein